ncbi:porin [Paucibacter sp. R3-3]|uniref:Porin n=1 Tax=Roseateles agri TaxID=3098619 RepID=A0ABU5DBL9_9BURK|nr:porin [Paucibacter sp. R3-3]MDY0743672.1 porin [Paucibacter sp. R3-3]
MNGKRKAVVLATLVFCSLAAQAQQKADQIFSLSGFGTLGVVGTDGDGAQYLIPGQVRGADKSWSGEVDSKLGVQLGAKFNSMFSATVQVLSKQDGEGRFTPGVEWAFAKMQATPGLALRLGRMGAPLFAVSDVRDVGYANTWLRPPIDVYGQVPISHFDGGDLTWQTSLGGRTLTLQGLAGHSSSKVGRVKVDIDSMLGINATYELMDGLTLRLGHVTGKLSVRSASLDQLVGLLRQTPFAGVGDQLDAHDKRASFSGLGLNYDQGDWIAIAEYTKRKTQSFIPDTTGWYVTLGYRVGQFTPYATLSQQKTDNSNVDNTIPPSVVVASLPLAAVVDATTAAQSTPQKTAALGVRWDAWRNVAVKAQWDSIKPTGGGQFHVTDAAFDDKRVNVYSLAVDFVF